SNSIIYTIYNHTFHQYHFSRVCNYKATIAQVERIKNNKLIYNEEYDQIESMIAKNIVFLSVVFLGITT
ncbi:MAG: hypothetical protein RR444_06275, partial [Oscillospiraceae bacterium]